MYNDECRHSKSQNLFQSRFHLVILIAPLGRPLSDLPITVISIISIDEKWGTHAKALTFLFFESFFIVIRLPCLSAYAFGSRVAYTISSCHAVKSR